MVTVKKLLITFKQALFISSPKWRGYTNTSGGMQAKI